MGNTCNELLNRKRRQESVARDARQIERRIWTLEDFRRADDSPVGYMYLRVDESRTWEVQNSAMGVMCPRSLWLKREGLDPDFIGAFDDDQEIVDWINWWESLPEE